ncbi:MAG: peptidoglycan/xylan/chitin deacetylase (PgdA/CDA1 family) [Crocinitomicaceae bacterium]|jgi:peptidoglycan/xylan/chitin deacetylase (PgdA/CDA1 family)
MRKTLFNIFYFFGLPTFLRRSKKDAVTILNIHRVSNDEDFFFAPITPERFDQLLKYCSKNYSIVSLNELEKPTPKRKLVLSFDDGYADFMEHAIPILEKYDVPSNHNLVNDCLNANTPIWTQLMNDVYNHLRDNNILDSSIIEKHGSTFEESNSNWIAYYASFFQSMLKLKKRERTQVIASLVELYKIENSSTMMSWEDAKLCQEKYKVEIGTHTFSHDVLSTLSDREDFNSEIGKSIEELESKLGRKTDTMALPNGQFDQDCIDYCKTTSLKRVLLVNNKLQTETQNNDNLNLINRVYLINEPIKEMILRTELFHAKFRR